MHWKRVLSWPGPLLCILAWGLAHPIDKTEGAGSPPLVDATVTTPSGVTIHYLQSGDRAGSRALILIPGWRLPAYLWKRQLDVFGSTMRVIALDPRSQGMSTMMRTGNTPEVRAKDLHEFLAALRVTRPVLVGWSQGAQDVAAYLQQYGNESVAAVVLVDSPVSIGPREVSEHPEFSQAILSGITGFMTHPEEYSKGSVRSLFKQPHPDLDFDEIVRSTLRTPVDTAAAMLIADIFGTDRTAALTRLDKPTLVIAAGSSPLLAQQKQMAAMIPGAKFLVMENAAHAVFIDQPERFDAALEEFLAARSTH